MVDNVFVVISVALYVQLIKYTTAERIKINDDVNAAIQRFMEYSNSVPQDAVNLSHEVAELYRENSVASHIIVSGCLNIFVDTIQHELKSKFFYIPHSTRMH